MAITVIIPFFNEYIYIHQALLSLSSSSAVKQIILIDDGPADNVVFLDDLKPAYPRLRVIRNDANIGAAASRNRGLALADTSHVMFLDADDFVSPTGLEEALGFAEKVGCDMLHLPTLMLKQCQGVLDKFPRDEILFGVKRSGLQVAEFPEVRYAVAGWSFLFRTDFLQRHEIIFDPEQRKFEDHLFLLEASQRARKIGCFHRWVHIWRSRGGSLSSSPTTAEDFSMQIQSFAKSMMVVSQGNESTSIPFQADLAFCFTRFLHNWPLLSHCLESMVISEDARETLEDLSLALAPYILGEDLSLNPIALKAIGPSIVTPRRRRISLEELPKFYEAIKRRRWPELARELKILVSQQLDSDASEPCHYEDLNSPNASQAMTYIQFVWDEYIKDKQRHNGRGRLFSEFIGDELSALFGQSHEMAVTPKQNLGKLAREIKRNLVDPSYYSGPSLRASESTSIKKTHRELETNVEQAVIAIETYFDSKLRFGHNLSEMQIAAQWRNVESAFAPGALAAWHADWLRIANDARYGDADPYGQRTFRSRARAVVKRQAAKISIGL